MRLLVLIEANSVDLKKGTKNILKNINWKIESGDRWILFGTNGSGKTTLLSILAGYYSPTSGKISLFDESPNEENILDLRKKIGWASASFFDRYFSSESILDIVLAGKTGSLCCDYNEISDSEIRTAKALLTKLGLKEKMRYTYDMLSHGQRQKVLVARAFMADAELLILDEPCNGMDILSREFLLKDLQTLLEEKNMALIYVTHHTDEILPFFNKALLLKNGEEYKQGAIKDVFTESNLKDFFEVPVNVSWSNNNLTIHMSDI